MKKNVIIVLIGFTLAILAVILGYQRFMKKPLVSVVMLTYKRADIVPRAIDSILAQTFKDYELVILNDGSPDNTDEVIAKYNDPRIKYYKNDKNRGIPYSRNRATKLARGKYVMIMDDDDISLPDRIEKQVSFMEKNPDIIVLSGQIEGLDLIPQEHNDIAAFLIQVNNVGNANTMFRREFVEDRNITYPDLDYGEDWYFWLEILFSGGKFAAIPDIVTFRNENSIKHYHATPQNTYKVINDYVGGFFSPGNPEAFYQADSCTKLKMIAAAPVKIMTDDYIQNLMSFNCP